MSVLDDSLLHHLLYTHIWVYRHIDVSVPLMPIYGDLCVCLPFMQYMEICICLPFMPIYGDLCVCLCPFYAHTWRSLCLFVSLLCPYGDLCVCLSPFYAHIWRSLCLFVSLLCPYMEISVSVSLLCPYMEISVSVSFLCSYMEISVSVCVPFMPIYVSFHFCFFHVIWKTVIQSCDWVNCDLRSRKCDICATSPFKARSLPAHGHLTSNKPYNTHYRCNITFYKMFYVLISPNTKKSCLKYILKNDIIQQTSFIQWQVI